ncbi:MAG TPA: aspartyl protease family protein [Terriglobales bacterium]|nr:aspartyl protease family protein [Terriglobales bacterium]
MAAADRLFASGRVVDALAAYQSIVNRDPSSVPAAVGLVRCYLVMQKLDQAQTALDNALALQPNSWLLQLTLGDLRYAQGKIPEAERAYVKAQNLKPDDAAPYLGLARVYRAYSLYRRAYDNLKRAHEVAPNDPAVQLVWFTALPHQDRIAALQAYIDSPGVSPQVVKPLQQYLAFLKRNADAPVHACRLVSKVEQTSTKLYAIPRPGTALGASGLAVKINNQELHLALDTGASGVLLGRTVAEKLKLQRLAYQPIVGMGDSGQQGGFTAAVDRIQVGDLEFQDCIVRVTDAATPVTGQDGLIGADVFSSYLIDIDIPGERLRLSPLPSRPNESTAPAALKTISQDSQELEAEAQPSEKSGSAPQPLEPALLNLPEDAYVAPEMANWTKVYRFRSLLMVPTMVDHTGPMLFLIDTGSFSNILSTSAAREITQIRSDPNMSVRGLSGTVSKIYRADKATLQFGHYEQENQDVVTFDLTPVSKQAGTQVSGILGFNMLRILQTKIDYRDGLVDFLYDPNHLPKQVRLNK